MKKYKEYIKKYWYCFVLGPIFMILEASGEFILPYINANIINVGAATGKIDYIIQNGIYMFIIAIGMLITGVLGAYFAIKGSSHLAAGVRKDVYHKIQEFSFSNIDDFSTGSLITRITNDVTQIQTFTQSLLRGFFRSPVMLVGAIYMSFQLNPDLAKIISSVVPFLALAIAIIIRIASPRYTIMQQKIDSLNNTIEESITNERVIKSFVKEEYEIKKFDSISYSLMDSCIKALRTMIWIQPLSALAINVATLAVVWVAGRQIMIGNMEIGTLTAFITYLTQILNALNFLANIFLQGTRALASDRRISQVLEAEVSLNDKDAKYKDKKVEKGDIEFHNVYFKYFKNSQEWVLNNINLHLNGTDFIGIIGSTGSGKSTLISLISRLYDVDAGQVKIDGVNVKDYSLFNLRESVSVVLQNNILFSGTIKENLLWGNENANDEQIQKACHMACADTFINQMEEGYQTILEQGASNLSGGQKQRLCIARALLKNPKILILDDSTSAVDTATDAKIRKYLSEIHGMTKIIIAQRIDTVKDANTIVVMDNGCVMGIGRHDELLKTCPTYQEIYYSQKDKEVA